MSLRMTDIIISKVCDKLQLTTMAGNHSDGTANVATGGGDSDGSNESSSSTDSDDSDGSAGSADSSSSSRSNAKKAANGHGKMTPYLHLRALIDGPKFAAQLRDQNHCTMCYCSTAHRATPNAAGEMCCSDDCLELYSQTHAGQL